MPPNPPRGAPAGCQRLGVLAQAVRPGRGAVWDAGHPSASVSRAPVPDPFGSSQQWLCSRSSASTVPSGPRSAAAARHPRGAAAGAGLLGRGSSAALPGSGAWQEEVASAADPCAELPGRPLPWPRCRRDIWAGQLRTMHQLRAVQGSRDAGAHVLLPCPTASCPAPLPTFCSWPWAAAQAPGSPWLRSQPHGTASLPPRPVPPLELVAGPSWHPCHLQALFLPWCWWQGPDLSGRGRDSVPPRCCRTCCPRAHGAGRTERCGAHRDGNPLARPLAVCASLLSVPRCASRLPPPPLSVLLGSVLPRLFFLPGAAWPRALEPLALRGAPCRAGTAHPGRVWVRQPADSAQGSLQAVQRADQHLCSAAALASRGGCCQAARSVPSGDFPAPPARVWLLGGLTSAGDRTGKGCVAGCWDACPGKRCGDGSPHLGSVQHGGCRGVWDVLGGALRGLQWHRAVCRDALCPRPALALGGLAQLSSLHPGRCCRGVVGGVVQLCRANSLARQRSGTALPRHSWAASCTYVGH